MFPILFTINGFAVSTLAVFLYLSFFLALFVIWRVSQFYELEGEVTLDLFLMTALISLIGARVYFVLSHLTLFDDYSKMFNILKYPGYSFWGGVLIGIPAIYLLSKQFKLDFYKIADVAILGVFLGIAVSSFGCLLGGCQAGLPSNDFFAVYQSGLLGKRFPLQIIESAVFLFTYFHLFKSEIRYHHPGTVFAKGLFYFGLFKLILEQFRADRQWIFTNIVSIGDVLSFILLAFGIFLFYKKGKRTLTGDISYFFSLFVNTRRRKTVVLNTKKNWYNLFVSIRLALPKWRKDILKFLNVKSH